jgi:hypothetical protein
VPSAITPTQKWAWVRSWLLPNGTLIQEPMNPATTSNGRLQVTSMFVQAAVMA